jgi:hypothetical protein
MNGFLFFHILSAVCGQLSMLPRFYAHQHCHYKFSDAAFYPTSVYTLAEALLVYPLFTSETILSCAIPYWFIGLSADGYGSRFAFFYLIVLLLTLVISILFRMSVVLFAKHSGAVSMGGMVIMFTSLLSGFIQTSTACL